jgi:hypothetical protein
MRVRRAQELHVELSIHGDVVGEHALSAQQRVVLDARHRSPAAETGWLG